jgi:hypothetical protein
MDIFKILENLQSNQVYREINSTHHILPLSYKEHTHIYSELKFNDTYHFIDNNEDLNFIAKLNPQDNINRIINSRSALYVSRNLDIPVIEFIFENEQSSLSYKFKFNLFDNKHLNNIKHLLRSKKVYLYFLTNNNNLLYKNYSNLVVFDEFTLNKFTYFLEFCYNGYCPRIEFEGFSNQNAYFFIFDCDATVLEDILDITEKLQKWGSRDTFTVSVERNNNYKLYFSGNISNLDYFKKELTKKYRLIDEGTIQASGKPFFRYSQGSLYFFKD